MPDKVFDILTEFTFAANDEELIKMGQQLGKNSNLSKELQANLDRLDAERKKDGLTVARLKEINVEYARTQNALNKVNGEHKEQLGLLGQLQKKARELQERLMNAGSRKEIGAINKELKQTQAEMGKLSGQGNLFKSLFSKVGFALAAAFSVQVIKQFGDQALEEFEQAEEATNRLLLALRNFNRERFFDQLVEQADTLAEKFKFLDNDDLVAAQQKLVTYGKVSINQIKELLPVIVDYAANQRVSIDEATEAIIRGLEGQGRAFKQIGVNFRDGASTAENFEVITTNVFNKVKGSAEDFGKSIAGVRATAKQAMNDIKEELGEKIAPVYVKFLKFLNDTTTKAGEFFRNNKEFQTFIEGYKDFYKIIVDIIGPIGKSLIPVLLILGEAIGKVYKAVSPLVKSLGEILVPGIQGLLKILTPVIAFIANFAVGTIKVLSDTLQTLAATVKGLIGTLNGLKDIFVGVFTLSGDKIIEGTKNIGISIAKGVGEIYNIFQRETKRNFDEDRGKVLQYFRDLGDKYGTAVLERFRANVSQMPDFIRRFVSPSVLAALDQEIGRRKSIAGAGAIGAARFRGGIGFGKSFGTGASGGADDILDPNADVNGSGADQVAEKRIQLQESLEAKITELFKTQNQLRAANQKETSASILERINAERDGQLKLIDQQERTAKREGVLTEKSSLQFARIRQLIRDNADLQYQKANKDFLDKLEKDQAAFNLNMKRLELQQAQERLKLGGDTLEARQALIKKSTEIELAETQAQFDILRQNAIDLGLSTEEIEKDRQDKLFIVTTNGKRRLLEAEQDFVDLSLDELHRANDLGLQEIEIAIGKQEEVLRDKFRRGKISQSRYQDELAEIERKAQAVRLMRQIEAGKQEIRLLEARLKRLQALKDSGDPTVTDADIDAAKARVNEAIIAVNQLQGQLAEVRLSTTTNFDRLLGKVKTFYQEYVLAAAQAIDAVLQMELDKNQRLIDAQRERVDAAKELANKGGAEILRREQDRLQKLEEAHKKYARTQRAIQAALIISQNALNVAQAIGAVVNAAATGDPYSTAGRVAAAVIALAAGIAASVAAIQAINVDSGSGSGFFKGGYTGDGDPRQKAGPVHKKEFVFDHKSTDRIGKDTLERLRSGQMKSFVVGDNIFMMDKHVNYAGMNKDADFVRNYNVNNSFNTKRIEKKLDAVVDSINGLPGANVVLDKDGFAISMIGAINQMSKLKNL